MVSFGVIAKRLPPGGAEWVYSSEICVQESLMHPEINFEHFIFYVATAAPAFQGLTPSALWYICMRHQRSMLRSYGTYV